MNRESNTLSNIALVLAGAAIGALAMYILDPDRGNRRRAIARDKMYSVANQTRKNIYAKSRDLANRTKGVYHKAWQTLH